MRTQFKSISDTTELISVKFAGHYATNVASIRWQLEDGSDTYTATMLRDGEKSPAYRHRNSAREWVDEKLRERVFPAQFARESGE